MTIRATYRVEFSQQAEGREAYLSIELDPDLNNGKYAFVPGTDVYLTVYTSHPIVEIFSSWGAVSFSYESEESIEEYIPVEKEEAKNIRYFPIAGSFSCEWLGPDRGHVTLDGRRLKFVSSDFFGFLKVSYRTQVMVYCLNGVTNEGRVCVIMANTGGQKASYMLEFLERGEESLEESDVTVVIKDLADGHPVPGCAVKVDGEMIGVTNDQGKVYAGRLAYGRHDLLIIPPAPYIRSDEDGLANDWFAIE